MARQFRQTGPPGRRAETDMSFDNSRPRVPAGRREGGQFVQTNKADEITDLASKFGDDAFVSQIVAAGREAYVAGISAERVGAFLEAVGRNNLLAEDEAAMRLTIWSGLDERGHPLEQKNTLLTKEQENRLFEKTDEKPERTYLTRAEQRMPLGANLWEPPTYVRLTEEGRRLALANLLAEAHDRQIFAARQFGFSDDAAEEYAHWITNRRLAEATRNLGKKDKETLALFATTLLADGLEKYVTRPVPKPDEAYLGVARLGRAFEGTNRVGTDFTRYVALLKPRNAETERELWDTCARKRMDEALGTAWDASSDKAKAKFGVEPIGYWEFYNPFIQSKKDVITPLNYRPAKENPRRLAEIRKLAASGDKKAMATVAAWDAAVKSAGSHNATMLSDGRSSTPFARNRVHRTIELPYKPESMSVEGTRRGARYVFRYTDGLTYYKDGIAQFRQQQPISLNRKVGTDDNAAEFGDLLTGSRAGGSFNERAAADPAEVFAASQHYASAAAMAAKLPNDTHGNARLRTLLDVDDHAGITDKRRRALAFARDITNARTDGMPEEVVRRVWSPQIVEITNAIAKARRSKIAHAQQEAEAAKARLRRLAAQRRAAQPAR